MYKKCYATRLGNNKYKIHLWDEGGYDEIEWYNPAYQGDPDIQLQHQQVLFFQLWTIKQV